MKLYTGQTDHFVNRHNGAVAQEDIDAMLKVIGMSSIDELINKTVPSGIRMQGDMDIKPAVLNKAITKAFKGDFDKDQSDFDAMEEILEVTGNKF